MGATDLIFHLLGLLAPAAFLAVVLPTLAPRLLAGRPALGWKGQAGLVFLAGAAVLVAGLAWFGRDGKVATYGALVLAAAGAQWLAMRAWK